VKTAHTQTHIAREPKGTRTKATQPGTAIADPVMMAIDAIIATPGIGALMPQLDVVVAASIREGYPTVSAFMVAWCQALLAEAARRGIPVGGKRGR
jgi:hypothetical protein